MLEACNTTIAPQANIQPGSPAMQLMLTHQSLLLLMPRTTTMVSNVEWHEDARTVHRTTVSNVEYHKNILIFIYFLVHNVTWFLLINQYLQNILLGLLESR